MSTYGTEHDYADGLDEAKWRALIDEHRCECDDCGWRGHVEDINSIHHVHERIGEGETMAAGQCPECAALIYTAWGEQTIANREKAETSQRDAARAMLAALKHAAAGFAVIANHAGAHQSFATQNFEEAKAAVAQAEAAGITPKDA